MIKSATVYFTNDKNQNDSAVFYNGTDDEHTAAVLKECGPNTLFIYEEN